MMLAVVTTIRRRVRSWAVFAIALSVGVIGAERPAEAYKLSTHGHMTAKAAERSELSKNTDLQRALGLERNFAPALSELFVTPNDVISQGSLVEDELPRFLNHFYNPLEQEGFTLGRPGEGEEIGIPSPRWVLEPDGEEVLDVADIFTDVPSAAIEPEEQNASIPAFRQELFEALTAKTYGGHQRKILLALLKMGQIAHHMQDMAQPEHTRDDSHCAGSVACVVASFRGISPYSKSYYERFARARINDEDSRFLEGYPKVELPRARQYWEYRGKGIAEYSNTNFVSVDTDFRGALNERSSHPAFPEPSANDAVVVEKLSARELLPADSSLTGQIWFLKAPVSDKYLGTPESLDHLTTSFSVLNTDLEPGPGTPGDVTFSGFNQEAPTRESALEFLGPRAVGYSAGLMDHLLRGRLEISAPESGVYGAVDHGVKNQPDEGFELLKMRLRNVTDDIQPPGEDAVPQDMRRDGGILHAVVEYRRNPCYVASLEGHIHSGSVIPVEGCDLEDYFDADKEVATSFPALVPETIDSADGGKVTFHFPVDERIPINARDVVVRVVYRGALGMEEDGLAFGSKDLGEPSYIQLLNMTDQFFLDGEFHTPEEIRTTPELRDKVDLDDDGTIDVDIATEDILDAELSVGGVKMFSATGRLEPKRYYRVAVLGTPQGFIDLSGSVRFGDDATTATPFISSIPSFVAQLQREPFALGLISVTRGLHHYYLRTFSKKQGDEDPTAEDLEGLPEISDEGPVVFD